ncbi:MAG TPA: ChuX/HutX family heme-like substrate-binding protein [Aquabacterium sp.]|uniref:hemin-degrading factor n=1 Tax=Aquabacterium sp. TaxID=1872578 RepID=UPI002E32554A|nr:ChuX/HutX family heme-like substrate-binding protein [Aquabacterium sp.]HEX5372532.1 ChuX/HutX family heme-like substrate-binding protein [Aquabacterium sp.]
MPNLLTNTLSRPHLRAQFASLRAQGLRSRDAAARLHISEGEALLAHAVGPMNLKEEADSRYSVTVLDDDWVGLLRGLEGVGPVMALTRNDHVVHEKIGTYRHVSAQGHVGLVLGPEIDLRLFLAHWHMGLHVVEHDPQQGDTQSLQFFDAWGRAVHKVHARPHSDLQALETLVQQHARPQLTPVLRPLDDTAPRAQPRPDAQIDRQGLGEAWQAMQDTHEFFDLLRRFGAERQQALRLMEGTFTHRTPLVAVEWLLRRAAREGLPIMVFAGNAGCLQIHTGAIERIETMGPWLNVLDAGFNLHLRSDAIHESWLVTKPTADGEVTSIEVFDDRGDLICMFFGERKPGQPELPAWRTLAHSLTQAPTPADRPAGHREAA